MAVCRWSSNDYQCDVYVYESEEGWQTHVASKRIAYTEPLPDPVDWTPGEPFPFTDWLNRHQVVSRMMFDSEHLPIGGPKDGASFCDETAAECADRLEELRTMGYNVPQEAIDTLRAEDPEH